MNRLNEFIRSLHPAIEFGIVFLVAFAGLVIGSHSVALGGDVADYSASALRELLLWELLVLLGLGWFLAVRGWDFAGQRLHPTWIEGLQGLLIGIGVTLGFSFFAMVTTQIFASTAPVESRVFVGLDWPTLMAVSVVNPLFEELLVCAYVITAVEKPLGIGLAIAVSASLRAGYHTYQGAEAFFAILFMGVVFAVWFARTRQLWPLIVAHALLDFLPLLPFVEV